MRTPPPLHVGLRVAEEGPATLVSDRIPSPEPPMKWRAAGSLSATRCVRASASTTKSSRKSLAVATPWPEPPIEYTRSLEDGVSLKDLAELWAEEGFGRTTSRALGKKLRMRTDACKYKGDILSGSRDQSKARGIKGWRLTRN